MSRAVCSECDRPVKGRGLCHTHYMRLRRRGEIGTRETMADAARLPLSECQIDEYTARIPLRAGRLARITAWALVDLADFERVNAFFWQVSDDDYARRTDYSAGKKRTVQMSRWIVGVTDPTVEVDHRNHNTLDNRRQNLRVVTHAENCENLIARNGVRGVYWNKQLNKWHVRPSRGGVHHHLGYFDSEEEAVEVATAWYAENMPHSPEAEGSVL